MDFIRITIPDILDIFLVAVLIYQLFRLIRKTNAISIFVGLLSLYLVYIVVRLLDMELLSFILGQILGVGVIALVIVFQPEIRKFLFILGGRYSKYKDTFIGRLIFGKNSNTTREWIDEVVTACVDMAKTKTGALIVVTRTSDMEEFTMQGEVIQALIKGPLIENIFFKNSPLHDGAVIIEDGRILAARCILPMSRNIDLPAYYGTRHRAALGVTEASDAFSIVVSEERGKISFVDKGQIISGINAEQLRNHIEKALSS